MITQYNKKLFANQQDKAGTRIKTKCNEWSRSAGSRSACLAKPQVELH